MSDQMRRLKQLAGLRPDDFNGSINESSRADNLGYTGELGAKVPDEHALTWEEIKKNPKWRKAFDEAAKLLRKADDHLEQASRVNRGRLGPGADAEVERHTKPARELTKKAQDIVRKAFGYEPFLRPHPRGGVSFAVDRRKVKQ